MDEKKYADRNQRSLEFQVGDYVLAKLNLQMWKKIYSKTQKRRLIPRYNEPFEVVQRVG